MSSTDLNSEDYFSDHPKRLPSFDDLFRAQAQLSPERFFRNLEQQCGESHCNQDDFQRAVFLFRSASDSAPDNFAVNYFPGGRLGGAVRMSCPSRRLAAIRFCGGYLVRVSRWGNTIF